MSDGLREAIQRLADERTKTGGVIFGGGRADAMIWPDELRTILALHPAPTPPTDAEWEEEAAARFYMSPAEAVRARFDSYSREPSQNEGDL